MSTKSSKSERYDIIVFESFEYKGQKRHIPPTTPPPGTATAFSSPTQTIQPECGTNAAFPSLRPPRRPLILTL
jgi:hypothetical protein